eukprot:9254714-Alexandrium_andersonii.AAC.1
MLLHSLSGPAYGFLACPWSSLPPPSLRTPPRTTSPNIPSGSVGEGVRGAAASAPKTRPSGKCPLHASSNWR